MSTPAGGTFDQGGCCLCAHAIESVAETCVVQVLHRAGFGTGFAAVLGGRGVGGDCAWLVFQKRSFVVRTSNVESIIL